MIVKIEDFTTDPRKYLYDLLTWLDLDNSDEIVNSCLNYSERSLIKAPQTSGNKELIKENLALNQAELDSLRSRGHHLRRDIQINKPIQAITNLKFCESGLEVADDLKRRLYELDKLFGY